jgi:hypothetical protein
MNQYVIFTSEKGVCAQTPVRQHKKLYYETNDFLSYNSINNWL